MPLRPLDEMFGGLISVQSLALPRAIAVARLIAHGDTQGYRFDEARRALDGTETLVVRVQVDRPQRFVHPVKPVEPVALHFRRDGPPLVLALRDDFPYTPHQNPGHKSDPISLCIDDRPWLEARPSWTPTEFLVRIQTWFAKTARGELHGNARAPEPVFVNVGPVVVIDQATLSRAGTDALDLAVYRIDAETRREILLTSDGDKIPAGYVRVPMVMMAMAAGAQDMLNIRFPPRTFGELADELQPLGIDLREQIKRRLRSWVSQAWAAPLRAANASRRDPPQLASRLGIVIGFQIRNEGATITSGIDLRAFLTAISMAELGVRLGCLDKGPDGTHGQVLGASDDATANDVDLLCSEVHLALDRDLARTVSGHSEPDTRPVTLIGAGAVGSHVANSLAREGLFTWTVIDEDYLLPHNPPRHVLLPAAVGMAKASALASQIDEVLGRPGTSRSIVADILDPVDANFARVNEALASAELIFDGSASVAVGRHLSDLSTVAARRASFFFNPDGTDAVLLAEPRDRSTILRGLEAQYYSMLMESPDLSGHLRTADDRIAYSGACRQATNRMPESRVAALSALIAMEIKEAIADPDGRVVVWRTAGANVRCVRSKAESWERVNFGTWRVLASARPLSGLGIAQGAPPSGGNRWRPAWRRRRRGQVDPPLRRLGGTRRQRRRAHRIRTRQCRIKGKDRVACRRDHRSTLLCRRMALAPS